MGRITDVVKNLLIINVIIFFGVMSLYPELNYKGSLFFPVSDNFEPYQLITHMFLHSDFRHLLMNMLSLFFLGPMVEQALGAKRFLQLYFLSALGAVILHFGLNWLEYETGVSNDIFRPVLGASGAIFGVTVAFATLFPNLKLMLIFLPVPIKAKHLILASVVFTVFAGIFGIMSGVAHWAHLGGAIVGFIMIRLIWKMQSLR